MWCAMRAGSGGGSDEVGGEGGGRGERMELAEAA